jgi:hypothetical protein
MWWYCRPGRPVEGSVNKQWAGSVSTNVSRILVPVSLHWKLVLKKKSILKIVLTCSHLYIQGDTKKRELLKNPTKIEEIQQKNFIDRNWTITTCLLRDSNTNYKCLKITSCRWHPPLRMQYFNLPLRFPIARCNIWAGIPWISSWILCFNSSIVLGWVV